MRRFSYPILSSCIIVLLLGLNFALIRQNRELKVRLAQPAPAMQVSTGALLPALEGFGAQGEKLLFDYGRDARPTVIFVFSPTCSFCEENWPRWRQVTEHLDQTLVRAVAVDVSSSATPEFASAHGLAGMPLLVRVEPKSLISYRFRLTPQTIVINAQGRVEKVWSGVLTADQVREASALMGRQASSSRVFQPEGRALTPPTSKPEGATP